MPFLIAFLARYARTIAVALAMFAGASTASAEFKPIDTIPTGQGVVYIFRPSAFVASGQEIRIAVDGKFVAELYNGRYLSLVLPPGFHVISFDPFTGFLMINPHCTPTDVNVVAGGSSFVRATWTMSGLYSNAVQFQGLDERDALRELSKLRPEDD